MFMFSLFRQIHQLRSSVQYVWPTGNWKPFVCWLGKRCRAWRKQASNLAQPNWQLFDSICPRIDWFVSGRPLTIPQIPRFMSSFNGQMSSDHFQTNYAWDFKADVILKWCHRGDQSLNRDQFQMDKHLGVVKYILVTVYLILNNF